MALKRGLGKGLSALLPDEQNTQEKQVEEASPVSPAAESESRRQGEVFLELDKLKANPEQPRKDFDEAELEELADSIRHQGIIQPIIAEDAGDGSYIIVAGERRTRAARIAGLTEVPVILRKYTDEKRMEISLVENIQRSNLNPIDEAVAYRNLMAFSELTQDDLAVRVGKNRATVANALRLLKLPREMQDSVRKNELSPGHARAILSLKAGDQNALFAEIIKKGLSVREAEMRAAAMGSQSGKKQKTAKERSPELKDMEEKFITSLGTKVTINGDLNKGSIVIDYYSMEDLDRLYELLCD